MNNRVRIESDENVVKNARLDEETLRAFAACLCDEGWTVEEPVR